MTRFLVLLLFSQFSDETVKKQSALQNYCSYIHSVCDDEGSLDFRVQKLEFSVHEQ